MTTVGFSTIKSDKDLVRDRETGAVLQTSKKSYEQFKAKRLKQERMLKLEQRVNDIDNKLDAILGAIKGN